MGPQPGGAAWQPRERCRVKRACADVVQAAAALRLGWWRFWERASTLLAVSDQTQPVSGEMRLVLSQPLASTSRELIGVFRSSIVTPRSLTSTDSGLLAMPMPPLRSGCRTTTPCCTPGTKS